MAKKEVTKKTTTKKQAPKHQAVAPKRKKKQHPLGFLVALIIVAIFLLATVAAANYVTTLDTIYPNVTLMGEDFGGMTVSEAANKLDEIGYTSTDTEVTIILPMDNSLTIKTADATQTGSSLDTAAAMYDYGRDGNILQNLITYIRCAGDGYDAEDGAIEIDEDYVRTAVQAEIKSVNEQLMGDGLVIGESSIRAVKGATSIIIDEEAVYNLVITALTNADYSETEYIPESSGADDINLAEIYNTVYVEAKDAEYDTETYSATESVVGVSFDLATAEQLWNSATTGDVVEIALIFDEPEISTEFLNSRLFADTLSSKTTSLYGSSDSRINNVNKASEAINGMVLNPGEEFSFNVVVGERTAANGFLPAGAYSGGEVVTEYGGGICQVSSTIYYCALYANLEIVSRTCHYFSVGYLPYGLDATVSWGGPEFVFKNNTEYPIKIMANVDGYDCNVEIIGTDVDGSYVVMTTESWVNSAGSTCIQSYRNVYDEYDNLISSEKEASSEYHIHTEDEEEEEDEETTDEETTEETTDEEVQTDGDEEVLAETETETDEPSPEASPEVETEPETETETETETVPEETPEVTPEATTEVADETIDSSAE